MTQEASSTEPTLIYDGASGGLGRHLARELGHLGLASTPIRARLGDVEQFSAEVRAAITRRPIAFIQAAAKVSVSECERHPEHAIETNVLRAMRTIRAFLDEADRAGAIGLVVYTSSAHVYSPPREGERITEEAPTRPRSVYASTKLRAEKELRQLVAEAGAKSLVARVFGLVGPGQASHYLLPGLIERARSGNLEHVPGLNYVRDYLDARDVAAHLGRLAARGVRLNPGHVETVNVCSGEGTTVHELLQMVLRCMYGDSPAYRRHASKVSGAPGRDTDVAWLVGDPSHLLQLTGLSAARRIHLHKTVADAIRQ